MVRRGGVEGHALTPQALLRPGTPPISQLATWRHGGGSRLLWEKRPVGFASFHLWAFLPPSLLLPGGKQPREVGGLLL